jgi:hypothetical protein
MGTSPVAGALLPAGINAHIEPAIVSGLESLQTYVGGTIDAVRQELPDGTVLVGYVHDEGFLLDLPVNWFASALFLRELRGPVVLVSGTSPSGAYDGENYDVPNHIYKWLTTRFTEQVAETYNESMAISAVLEAGRQFGLISEDEMREFHEYLERSVAGEDYEAARSMKEMLDEFMQRIEEYAIGKQSDVLVNEVEDFLKGGE